MGAFGGPNIFNFINKTEAQRSKVQWKERGPMEGVQWKESPVWNEALHVAFKDGLNLGRRKAPD